MDFKQATDLLMGGYSLDELAEELSCSRSSIAQARLDPSADGYRSPPPNWRPALARLAQDRGEHLLDLARALSE